jgi:hypothetical protein
MPLQTVLSVAVPFDPYALLQIISVFTLQLRLAIRVPGYPLSLLFSVPVLAVYLLDSFGVPRDVFSILNVCAVTNFFRTPLFAALFGDSFNRLSTVRALKARCGHDRQFLPIAKLFHCLIPACVPISPPPVLVPIVILPLKLFLSVRIPGNRYAMQPIFTIRIFGLLPAVWVP